MWSRQSRSSSAAVTMLPGRPHNEGDDLLAPLGVCGADNARLGDARIEQQQHLLDLARIDVGAAADDEVLGAPSWSLHLSSPHPSLPTPEPSGGRTCTITY